MISDSLWWNWGGRGRLARFGEDVVIIHTPEWSGRRKSLTLSQFMEDGTIMFSYLLAKRLSFSFPLSSSVWVASLPGIVKGKGCCSISGSLMFCNLTGERHKNSKLGGKVDVDNPSFLLKMGLSLNSY